MKKNISVALLCLTPFLFSGCVSKMIGGAVSVATFGLVENEHTQDKVQKKEEKRS